MRHFLLPFAMLLSAMPLSAQILDGADLLLEGGMSSAQLSPALPDPDGGRFAFGLNGFYTLRNDHLSLSFWNDHAGHFLDDLEKREIMDKLGGSLQAWQRSRFIPLEAQLYFPDAGDTRIGVSLELLTLASIGLDTELLEVAFFGNDPYEEVTIDEADFAAEASFQIRFTWSRLFALPASAPVYIAGLPLRVGLGAKLEGLGYKAQTIGHEFSIQPVVGVLDATFSQEVKLADTGYGFGLDLGINTELELLDQPLLIDFALNDLFHVRHWLHVWSKTFTLDIPETGIASDFDEELFEDAVVDEVLTSSTSSKTEFLKPGWMLGFRWLPGENWSHALFVEQFSEGVVPGLWQRAGVYSRWNPGAGMFHLGAGFDGGMGRGPALGGDFQIRLRHFEFGLSAKGYAGIGNASRGVTTGLLMRFLL